MNLIRYELDVKLFAGIKVEESSHGLAAKGVQLKLRKTADDLEWSRLAATRAKLPWLMRDFDSWLQDGESDEEVQVKRSPLLDPGKK